MTTQIKRAYIRHYSDNDQTTAYVEWSDGSRTEGDPDNTHMIALLKRAWREGKTTTTEQW